MQKQNIKLILFSLIFQFSYSTFCPVLPEQIHLSLGENLNDIVITWITFTDTRDAFVWYSGVSEGLTWRKRGTIKKFENSEENIKVRFVNKVVLHNLKPFTFYEYRCGSRYGVSDHFIFKVSPEGVDWSPRLLIYGDMGWKGAGTLPYIEKEVSTYQYDAVVHIGDIAYNMESHGGFVGDQFMKMIQPVASIIPYMTTVGNHEQNGNFSFYKNIFSMPGSSEGLFYSFDMGPAHFIAISTEVYYFENYGIDPLINQYEWLKEDLRKATTPESRKIRPWIIVFGHRPMYCSSDNGEDCSQEISILRSCFYKSRSYSLENLFYKSKVDMFFSGHMHYYERSWPIFNKQVFNGSCAEPYVNPGATVHIITGAAGMAYGTEYVSYVRSDWFAFFSDEYSYTNLYVLNDTHLYLQQISASRGGEIIDSMWLIKK